MTTYAAHYLLSPAGGAIYHKTPSSTTITSSSASTTSSYSTFPTETNQAPSSASTSKKSSSWSAVRYTPGRALSISSTTPLTSKPESEGEAEAEGEKRVYYDSHFHSSTAKANGTAKWYDFLKPLE